MSSAAANESSGLAGGKWFTTTHWTVVLQAAGLKDPDRVSEALEELCRAYWYPLYAFVRRQGHSPDDAQDLTQDFFARFLKRECFRLADRRRGRFRSFLLTAMKHFLINEWDRSSARKRGGGRNQIPLHQLMEAEDLYTREPSHDWTAEKIYERSWALSVLRQVRSLLRQEYSDEGKTERFIQLEQFLPGGECELTYAEAADRLGVAEGTIKSDVHRLKQRYRDLLRKEIANTVATRGEIDEELRHLIRVLAG
jgi:RNA polymerase sigma factor (sigma-70 family)